MHDEDMPSISSLRTKERQIISGRTIVMMSQKQIIAFGITTFKLNCWNTRNLLRCQYASAAQYCSLGKKMLFRSIS